MDAKDILPTTKIARDLAITFDLTYAPSRIAPGTWFKIEPNDTAKALVERYRAKGREPRSFNVCQDTILLSTAKATQP